MKRNDYILIAIIFLISVSGIFYLRQGNFKEGTSVIVTVDGKEYGRYSLFIDKKIQINGHNTLVIKNKTADMIDADCPDKLCVKQKSISKTGETIICLPNRVVVSIQGGVDDSSIDAIVN